MAQTLYDDYTLRLRKAVTMLRLKVGVIKEQARKASVAQDSLEQHMYEAVRLQTRFLQRRAHAASKTKARFDSLFPRLYAREWEETEFDFKPRIPSRPNSPRATATPRSPQRGLPLVQLDTPQGVPRVSQRFLTSGGSSLRGVLGASSASSARQGPPGFPEDSRGSSPPQQRIASTSSLGALSQASSDEDGLANLQGGRLEQRLEELLSAHLARHAEAMKSVLVEAVRAELDARSAESQFLGALRGRAESPPTAASPLLA